MSAADSTTVTAAARPRLTLGTQVLIGLGLGVAVGIFAGERAAFLGVAGTAFILLLQITVIPFIAVSLITALGRLTLRDAGNLGLKAGALLLILWGVTLAMVLLSPLAFPDWPSASFFSVSEIEPSKPVNFLQLYIPSNPFFSFANALVPAVVVFCVLIGLSLATVPNKNALLEPLGVLAQSLTRINDLIGRLAPYGIFALTAHAAGTMAIEELSRLQVYIATNVSIALLLSFWVLPGLITTLTPVRYGELLRVLREPLIAAFATGSLLIVLPMLASACKTLIESNSARTRDLDVEEARISVDALVPTAYNFPTVGLLLTLMFPLFCGWFVGAPVPPSNFPLLVGAGLPSLFGGTAITIPFLLDLLELPQDLQQLFFAVDVVNSRFGTLLAAMHVITLSLIGSFALQGRLQLRLLSMTRLAGITAGLLLVVLLGVRAFYSNVMVAPYTKDRTLKEMHLLSSPRPSKLAPQPSPNAVSPAAGLAEIRRRGVLRVCFFPDDYPSAFFNDAHPRQLVGFDIDLAHRFAATLGLSIEFLEVETLEQAEDRLRRGLCDVHASALPITPSRAESLLMTAPVLRSSAGFITKDHQREAFQTWAAMRELGPALRIAVPNDPDALLAMQTMLPQAKKTTIADRDSLEELLSHGAPSIDALGGTSERAAAWTILYPEYTLVVPKPVLFVPMGYAVAPGNGELRRSLDAWIAFEQAQGTIDEYYRYWMLGQAPQGERSHRWSVLRDVLHWVD